MKTAWFYALVVLAGMFLSGCATTNSSTTQPDPITQIASYSAEVQLGCTVATRISLLSLSNPADQASTGALMNEVATAVLEATNTNANLDDLDAIIVKVLADNGQAKYVAVAKNVYVVMKDLTEQAINKYFSGSDANTQAQAFRTILRAAAQGVANATSDYAPPRTATLRHYHGPNADLR